MPLGVTLHGTVRVAVAGRYGARSVSRYQGRVDRRGLGVVTHRARSAAAMRRLRRLRRLAVRLAVPVPVPVHRSDPPIFPRRVSSVLEARGCPPCVRGATVRRRRMDAENACFALDRPAWEWHSPRALQRALPSGPEFALFL